jgi:hypothetical protein
VVFRPEWFVNFLGFFSIFDFFTAFCMRDHNVFSPNGWFLYIYDWTDWIMQNYGISYTMIWHYSIGSLLNKKASLDLNLDGEKDTEMTNIWFYFLLK